MITAHLNVLDDLHNPCTLCYAYLSFPFMTGERLLYGELYCSVLIFSCVALVYANFISDNWREKNECFWMIFFFLLVPIRELNSLKWTKEAIKWSSCMIGSLYVLCALLVEGLSDPTGLLVIFYVSSKLWLGAWSVMLLVVIYLGNKGNLWQVYERKQ